MFSNPLKFLTSEGFLRRAGVAQLAEQRFCKPPVGGSIPLASSIPPYLLNNLSRFSQHVGWLSCRARFVTQHLPPKY